MITSIENSIGDVLIWNQLVYLYAKRAAKRDSGLLNLVPFTPTQKIENVSRALIKVSSYENIETAYDDS